MKSLRPTVNFKRKENMFFCNQCYGYFNGDRGEHNCHNEVSEFRDSDPRPLDEIYPSGQNKRDNIKQSKYEFKSYNYQKNKHHIDPHKSGRVSKTDLKLNPHLKKKKY